MRKRVRVCLLIKHEELYNTGRLVFDGQMQICLSKLFQLFINVSPTCFLLHLEYFNKLVRLVVLDELH
jgi:hypothetical protein